VPGNWHSKGIEIFRELVPGASKLRSWSIRTTQHTG